MMRQIHEALQKAQLEKDPGYLSAKYAKLAQEAADNMSWNAAQAYGAVSLAYSAIVSNTPVAIMQGPESEELDGGYYDDRGMWIP